VPEATVCPPSVVADTIMRTIELGATITDAAVDEKTTTIFCTPAARDGWCPACGGEGQRHSTADRSAGRRLPAGATGSRAPLSLHNAGVRPCGVQPRPRQTGRPAGGRRRCARYVLRRLTIDRATIAAITAELGASWHTVSSIAMRATAHLIAASGPDRLAGVKVIGVD
jgi:transposase